MTSASNIVRAPLALRLALRDFRGGLRGFWIFLACLALGLTAIVGVGSVSRSLAEGLVQKGRVILGGDMSFDLVQREANAQERAILAAHGRLSEIALMRAMARLDDGRTTLVEIKAVDAAYPPQGALGLSPRQNVDALLAKRDGVYGVAADRALAEKLGLKLGDAFAIGSQIFALRAILTSEPDKLAGSIGFGPRVLMSITGLRATGLLLPGSLIRWHYRLALAPGETVEAVATSVRMALPAAGFDMRTWKDVSPEFSRDLERFSQFLILVGLSALIIGGVGVANAVATFIERKRATIATLKALGAPGGFVFSVMLVEVTVMALIGMAVGVVLGAALPFVLAGALASLIPFPLAPAIFPREIAAGLLYGTLTALAFSLAPLGRAHDVPVASLFRDGVVPEARWPKRRYIVLLSLAALGLALAVIGLTADHRLALIFLASTAGGFLLLRGLAAFIMFAARRFRRVRPVEWRLAIVNLYRPGALTPSIVLSLGLGLTLIVALALIDGNLHRFLDQSKHGPTPNFYFLGLGKADASDFRNLVARDAGRDAKIELVPMVRGRIIKVKDTPVEKLKVKDDVVWTLQGDRGITFADAMPPGSTLIAGQWWPKNYSGPPTVSLAADVADGLGVRIGDAITVNVLGRDVTARVANLRKVDWENLGINFVLVYSPNTFAAAPSTNLATVTFSSPARDGAALVRDVTKAFPQVVSLRVKDALEAVKDVLDQLVAAVRAAASIALLAATLVLGGAIAAGQRARLYDVVVLKTLGATRWRLLSALVCEFGLVGFVTAIFGVLAGAAAALAVIRLVMKLDFTWLWPQALLSAGGAVAVAIVLGLIGTWRVLGHKPAQYLRNL